VVGAVAGSGQLTCVVKSPSMRPSHAGGAAVDHPPNRKGRPWTRHGSTGLRGGRRCGGPAAGWRAACSPCWGLGGRRSGPRTRPSRPRAASADNASACFSGGASRTASRRSSRRPARARAARAPGRSARSSANAPLDAPPHVRESSRRAGHRRGVTGASNDLRHAGRRAPPRRRPACRRTERSTRLPRLAALTPGGVWRLPDVSKPVPWI
jgi:hypothetical protein